MKLFSELDEIKMQLSQVNEDVSKQLVRKRSRTSESKSDSESNSLLSTSLPRQKSQDSQNARKGALN